MAKPRGTVERVRTTVSGHEAFDFAMEAARLGTRARTKLEAADRLRSSALELFSERGYDDVTVGDIADRAGLTSRTYFRYFPSKETVIVDITDQTNRRLIEIVETDHSDLPIYDALREAVANWFEELAAVLSLIQQLADSSETLTSALDSRQIHWEHHLSAAIKIRFPGRSDTAYRVWGIILFGLIRLSHETQVKDHLTFRQAVHFAFDQYAAEVREI